MRPTTTDELCDVIGEALPDGAGLRLRGGGSKDAIGAPTPRARVLDMRGFSGIVAYDPPELVLTAAAGTPLAEIERAIAKEGQMLAFDPFDHGPVFGNPPGRATLGGIVVAGISGPRRVSSGGVRDHLLGFEAVSGNGEAFKAGSRVVKNVTGFDLSKLIAGSWGRLVAVTSVTLKVVPRPPAQTTILLPGLEPGDAVTAMARAMGSSAGIAAAAHLPNWQEAPATLFRVDGFEESVGARGRSVSTLLAEFGRTQTLDERTATTLWDDIRTAAPLPADRPLWRFVVAPGKAPAVVETLGDDPWLMDWAGGLIWTASSAEAATLRAAAEAAGGHAALIRGDEFLRAGVPALHPPAPGVDAIESSLRRAFDPGRIFDCGRF